MPRGVYKNINYINKKCELCGKPFLARTKTEKYCCKTCQSIVMRRKITERKRLASIEKYKDTPGIAVCKECGFMGHDLFTHIKFAHNLTAEQYCKRWNCHPDSLLSKQTHETRSLAQKNSTNPNKKRFTSENNPAKGHGGKFSPFSKDFIKYQDLSEEEKEQEILKIANQANQTKMDNDNCVFTKEYYVKHFGMTDEEAEQALKERQTTFSLEKCIEKYGAEQGLERWKERQKTWMQHYTKSNYSKVSQKLFKTIDDAIQRYGYTTYYATKGDQYNNEYTLELTKGVIKPDYYIKELNLVIEFDGDYWHGTDKSGRYRDEVKDEIMNDTKVPYIRVKECDYNRDPQAEVDRCINFINTTRTLQSLNEI